MKRLRLLLLFVVLLALAPTTALAATVGATTLADPSSASTWRNWGLENSTQNVGRIWTDKTVSAEDIVLTGAGGEKVIPKEKGSDFLTAFSAISSTSNLRETATEPLDIVLVLDASGSMDDPMGAPIVPSASTHSRPLLTLSLTRSRRETRASPRRTSATPSPWSSSQATRRPAWETTHIETGGTPTTTARSCRG